MRGSTLSNYTLVEGPTVGLTSNWPKKPYRAIASIRYLNNGPMAAYKFGATEEEALKLLRTELCQRYGIALKPQALP